MYNFTEPFQEKKKEPKASEIQKIIYCLVSYVPFFWIAALSKDCINIELFS